MLTIVNGMKSALLCRFHVSSGLLRACLRLVLSAGLTGAAAAATTLTDGFDTSHDYSGGSTAGTIWDGVMFNSGFNGGGASLGTANSNGTHAGALTVTSTNGNWENGGDNGFLLYINVAGNFVATVNMVSATTAAYNDMGIMARAAGYADGGDGEDYVAGRYFAAGGTSSLRNTDDDSTENLGEVGGVRPFLKLERVGDVFTYTRATDAAFTQNVLVTSVTRSDLNGQPLQVGLWEATFSSTPGTAVFDNFSLTTVPEPSGVVLVAGSGLLALLRRRRR